MGEVSTIGLDIAKSVFQIHGVDVDGAVVIRKRVSRAKLLEFFAALSPCLVGIEACPTHIIGAAGFSVRPHGKAAAAELRKGLSEAQQERSNDAAAICEAVTRPSMRLWRRSLKSSSRA